MEKFSLYSQQMNQPEDEEYLYDGDYMKIKNIDGWEAVIEKDCMIVVPHLLDYNEIILRKESIPPFQYVEKREFFLTALSGGIEKGETAEKTLFRELEEEAGIRLNTGYKAYKKWNELFFNKGNTAKCHLYYLPLHSYDFTTVYAKGDGTESESKSTAVRIDLKYLDNLNTSDLVTCLLLEYLKSEIKK
jgi:8-oxo-dGTP pyrophosphatase MutT (NUDIX family)